MTVEPIVDLIARCFATGARPPYESEIANVLREIDYRGIEVAGSTIRLQQGMGVKEDIVK